ncbi:MAG: ABC transporter ATP-binding protein [bacterium]|nr:ABC transporter ATP-binding protein [bacterium]
MVEENQSAAMPDDNLLRLRGITAGYSASHNVLHGVNLSVGSGEFAALVGPNGSGKSTLLAVAAGYLPAQVGEVTLCGRPLNSLSATERARTVAWLTQELPNAPGYTVRQVVVLGRYSYLKDFGTYTPVDESAAEDALRRCDIVRLADRPVSELSGGERQRVFLAQALAQGARLMLFDEPTNHLDPASLSYLLKLLKELTAEGRGVLMVTHDLNLAARHADRMAILSGGRIVACGGPEELVRPKLLREVYGAEINVVRHPVDGKPQILL